MSQNDEQDDRNKFVIKQSKFFVLNYLNLSLKAANCSASRLRSLSISAKLSRVVKASCRAMRSAWPGGVSLSKSWSKRMNCGNLCTGLTIRPKKLTRSCAVICFTFKKSARADFLLD